MSKFVELENYPGYWIAHSPPRLRRVKGDKITECTQTPNSAKDNYWVVGLKAPTGKWVKRSMHRLLMETFIVNPQNKAHVNHIDGNKSNNTLNNLEWATPKENSQHAHDTGLITHTKSKPVYQYNLSGNFIAEFSTDDEAEKATGVPKQNISKATLGKRIHAGYYQWSRNKQIVLSPTKIKYISGYTILGIFYKTIKDYAYAANLPAPEKQCMSKLLRKLKIKDILIHYYD